MYNEMKMPPRKMGRHDESLYGRFLISGRASLALAGHFGRLFTNQQRMSIFTYTQATSQPDASIVALERAISSPRRAGQRLDTRRNGRMQEIVEAGEKVPESRRRATPASAAARLCTSLRATRR